MSSNSTRFINAYNLIDQTMRSVHGYKRNMTFSDMIRRSVSVNSVVRKYEDKLIDYARLRNAIIHNSSDTRVIAEPHPQVVDELEKIAKLISTPPLVMQTIAKKEVLILDHTTSLKKLIETISRTGFRTIPVYRDGMLIGVVNSARIVEHVGAKIADGQSIDEYISRAPVSTILREDDINSHYCIRSEKLTIQEALDLFFSKRKLQVIIITPHGNYLQEPTGIVTVADIMDMNNIIENYAL